MAHVIWCRYCDHEVQVIGGQLPPTCPNTACNREARWTTRAPMTAEPEIAWELNHNDKKWLRGLKISPE